MAIKTNKESVVPTDEGFLTVWRFLRADEASIDYGASTGLVIYGAPDSDSMPQMGSAHDLPEFHYVLSGRGFLLDEGELIELEAGDALVIEPGRRHAMWGQADDPLVAFYVALHSPVVG